MIITVTNSGNESIRVDDFDRALRFSWAEPTRILTAEVIEASPEGLQPTIRTGANEITVDPLLLNPGDWLRIKTLINNVGKLSVDARVVGLKRISKTITNGKDTFVRRLLLVAAAAVVGIMTMLVGEGLGLWVANGRAELRIAQGVILVGNSGFVVGRDLLMQQSGNARS